MYSMFKIAGIYAAVIIGAGFSSGQELFAFFMRFGAIGFVGLLISGVIFSFIGYAVLDICHKKHIDNYADFMQFTSGKFSRVIEYSVAFFLFILFATMLAATGASFRQEFNLSYTLGVSIMGIICLFIYFVGTDFVAKLNVALSPLLVIGGIYIGIVTMSHTKPQLHFETENFSWLGMAILYAAYNIVTGVSVLAPIITTVKDKKNAKYGGILGGVFMTVIGLFIAMSLFTNPDSRSYEIPMLSITHNLSNTIRYIYITVFGLALFTSAVGNFFGLCDWVEQKQKRHYTVTFITFLSVIFAHIGFSNFIGKIFPFFGLLGLAEIIFITIAYFRRDKT